MDNILNHFTDAAIRFYDPVSKEHKVYTGRRHHEIIKDIHDDGYTDVYKKYHIDGFIYDGEFISRDYATKIAEWMGVNMIGSVLTSEDLW